MLLFQKSAAKFDIFQSKCNVLSSGMLLPACVHQQPAASQEIFKLKPLVSS